MGVHTPLSADGPTDTAGCNFAKIFAPPPANHRYTVTTDRMTTSVLPPARARSPDSEAFYSVARFVFHAKRDGGVVVSQDPATVLTGVQIPPVASCEERK